MAPVRRAALLGLICGVLAVMGWPVPTASSDHSGSWLPLVPDTPMMRNLQADGVVSWCLDSRAAAYPAFRDQVIDVMRGYAAAAGLDWIEVAPGGGCEVVHSMPATHGCSGCAAWVLYANWPVLIEYRWQLGYSDWRSTIGHELGHALGGLHEQYADSGGQLACKRQTWTVMDCGSGVRYPTAWDVARSHEMLLPQRHAGGLLAGPVVWYGGSDSATTRLAVVYETYAGYRYWAGQYLTPAVGCAALVCGGGVIQGAGVCTGVYIGHENALRASWGRELQLVGWTPC